MVRAVEAFVGRLEKAVAALPETGHGLIVGRDVTSTGADQSSLEPMVGQIVARTGCQPKTVLVEGGFYNRDSVTRLTRAGMERLMPLRKAKRQDRTRTSQCMTIRRSGRHCVVARRRRVTVGDWTGGEGPGGEGQQERGATGGEGQPGAVSPAGALDRVDQRRLSPPRLPAGSAARPRQDARRGRLAGRGPQPPMHLTGRGVSDGVRAARGPSGLTEAAPG